MAKRKEVVTYGPRKKRSPAAIANRLARRYMTPPSSGPIREVARSIAMRTPAGRTAAVAEGAIRSIARRLFPAKKKVSFNTAGTYQGKFKKGKKVVKNMALNLGFVHTTEINGNVSDPDCVYLTHSSVAPYQCLELICHALLRKLFKRAGMNVTSLDTPIVAYRNGNSDGWIIEIIRQDSGNGSLEKNHYVISATDSIYTIVGNKAQGVAPNWPGFIDRLLLYAQPQPGSTVYELKELNLYRKDISGIQNFDLLAVNMKLGQQKCHLAFRSELKIQNRTKAASGSSDAEDVANNPLVGRSYSFNSGVPRCSLQFNNQPFADAIVESTGVRLYKGSQLPQGLKEPPLPKIFTSVKSSAKIRLEPGAIKKDVITFTMQGKLLKVLLELGFQSVASSTGTYNNRVKGKSTMIALEDMINFNVEHDISVAYEVNREQSCYITTGKDEPALGYFYQLNQSL